MIMQAMLPAADVRGHWGNLMMMQPPSCEA